MGESVTQATLLRWVKNDGDQVAKDDVIAELETDKANAELNALGSGVLKTSVKPGDTVKVGQVIAMLLDNGEAVKAAPGLRTAAETKTSSASAAANPQPGIPSPAASSSADAAATASKTDDLRPSVRRMVEENKLDPAAIQASGPGGKITKEDVVKHMESRPAEQPAAETAASAGSPTAGPPTSGAQVTPPPSASSPQPGSRPIAQGTDEATIPFGPDGTKRVAMTKIRKRIAQTLVQAQQTAAILTTFNEVDMSQIMSLRSKFKERFQEVHGIGLGFMSFFARAVILAVREFPRVNARIDGDDVVYHNFVHLGIAVSTERGLAVPVLRHAEQMGFAKIESEIKRLATAVKDGKLGIQELSGGTFSITNGGVFGSLLSTPILNPPQSAILGMHAIQQRPMAIDGKVEIRPMMYVALSYDHRLVDGRESVSFLVRVKQLLEDPARLMLEI
jgi:2-oxoglutarate dehydrogenase E2 component (dihydrolipoamide succinyltransferase)